MQTREITQAREREKDREIGEQEKSKWARMLIAIRGKQRQGVV